MRRLVAHGGGGFFGRPAKDFDSGLFFHSSMVNQVTPFGETFFTAHTVLSAMLYGERLKIAIERRGEQLGQEVSRQELAKVAGCSPQNITMILRNSKGKDQTLSSKSHAAVAEFLRVNPDWLLNEQGPMEAPPKAAAPSELSVSAVELAALYDMIPKEDKISRAKAFNAASTAIMQVLQDVAAK